MPAAAPARDRRQLEAVGHARGGARYCERLLELLPDERAPARRRRHLRAVHRARLCVEQLEGSGVAVYAQNMHQEETGAFTGEVSAPMLTEIGVDGVVLGHSERRQYFGETDRALQEKVPAALEAGLRPILCVGETRGGARGAARPSASCATRCRRRSSGCPPSGWPRS